MREYISVIHLKKLKSINFHIESHCIIHELLKTNIECGWFLGLRHTYCRSGGVGVVE